GDAKLIAEVREEDILLGNHIIIEYPKSIEDAMNDPISRQIIERYKSGNKRFLTTKQIVLAVIFCSTEYFCDPDRSDHHDADDSDGDDDYVDAEDHTDNADVNSTPPQRFLYIACP
ncbi:Nibrin, partial [Orchesella cincta]